MTFGPIRAAPHCYPEYIDDWNVYFCPSDADTPAEQYLVCPGGDWCASSAYCIGPTNPESLNPWYFQDKSYIYCGYMCRDDQEWMTMVPCRRHDDQSGPTDQR